MTRESATASIFSSTADNSADPDGVERRRQRIRSLVDAMTGGNLNAWAEAAGVRESTVRSFLDGTTASMTDRTYGRLATHYGLSIADLKGAEENSSASAIRGLRLRARLSMLDMANAVGLAGPSGWRYYEDADGRFRSYLPVEWRGPVSKALVGKGAPPITGEEVEQLFGTAEVRPTAGQTHRILIDATAVREIERLIAQAGPINAAPRDLARRILVDVLGFQVGDAPN